MDFIINEIEMLVQILILRRKNYNRLLQNSPPGGLIRIMRRKQAVYMHSVPDGKTSSGKPRYRKHVLTGENHLFKQLVLKEYLRVSLNLLDRNIRCLQHAKAGLLPMDFESVRNLMRKPYHAVSDMIISTQFASENLSEGVSLNQHKWAAEPYEQSTNRPDEKSHYTSRGLAVRSRAEVLIAELLYQYGIPFRYEQVVHIGGYMLAPDFTFLDYNGNEFYWEYCGRMDDVKYVDHQLWRRNMYESIGITEWNNMIYTYNATNSVDMRELKAIIETRILPRVLKTGVSS